MTERQHINVETAAITQAISHNSAFEAVHHGDLFSLRIAERILIWVAHLQKRLEGSAPTNAKRRELP